jgi:hypothetical protein
MHEASANMGGDSVLPLSSKGTKTYLSLFPTPDFFFLLAFTSLSLCATKNPGHFAHFPFSSSISSVAR